MKKDSYYKRLKKQKQELKDSGWVESEVIDESGKKKRIWSHADHEGHFSVNGASKTLSVESEGTELKNAINQIIDVINELGERVVKLEKIQKDLIAKTECCVND